MAEDSTPARDASGTALPGGVVELIPAYLARQRWYAGSEGTVPDTVQVVDDAELWRSDDGAHRLLWALVGAREATYQVLIGERPGGEQAEFLNGHEQSVLGSAGDRYYYDATLDPEMGLALISVASGGAETAGRVRPVGAEQSNTSLVYDDRVILKLFRRLHPGPNPDAEVTTALVSTGFTHAARPVARWQRGGWELAFAQEFLAGGTEGWALALTSLRDFYAAGDPDPANSGGDFAGEASRLGRMTAELHLAMAEAFGVERRVLAERWWPALVESIHQRLPLAASAIGGGIEASAAPFIDQLRQVTDPGPAMRVHGDYHLGQVMRTDAGWYVLDFEGEPARSVEERRRGSSTLKDVAGMSRSFDYAARVAMSERGGEEQEGLEDRVTPWVRHNRQAFIDGYRSTKGVGSLGPPDDATWAAVLAGYEMDKALYELDYEKAYRPDWAYIPLAAIAQLLRSA